jgi:hypothetical protein
MIGLCWALAKDENVRNPGNPEEGMIPDSIKKLKLPAEQEKKIREIVQSYDGSITTVWKQFGEQYMRTIALETAMLAAIEDNLTEDQRNQVRESRRKTAMHEPTTDKTGRKPTESTSKPAEIVKQDLTNTGVTLSSEQQEVADAIQMKYRPQLRKHSQRIQELHHRLISLEAEKLTAIEKELTKEQLAELRAQRRETPETTGVTSTSKEPKKAE